MRTLNLGILAHVDAGKTSLTERLLYAAGVIAEIGRVDHGNTQTDSLALEQRRGITIKSAVVSFVVDDVTVNLIDTPGHPDFIAEVERVLHVLDGAVLVISAVEGVQSQTRVLMRTLQRLGIPTLLFVNKVDRTGADPDAVLARIGETLTPSAIAMGARSDPARLAAVLAEHDDALLADYVDGSPVPTPARLRNAAIAQTRRALVHPVFFGSAITGAGTDALMAGLVELLPARAGDDPGSLSGSVFKVDRGPAGEKIAYVRMFSGVVRTRDRLVLRGNERKVTAIQVFERGGATQCSEVGAGRIAKLWGLGDVQIGDAIGRARREADRHYFAPPSLETVVVPKHAADKGVLNAALAQLAEQDPLINLRQDDVRQELFVSLYGEVQKEVIEETLANDFDVEVEFRETTTICVERPVGTGAAFEVIAKGGNPFLATVGLRVEPALIGSGVTYERAGDVLGTMPLAFFTAVEETVHAVLAQGVYGWQVTDVAVTLTHTGYWPRQSHSHATFDKSMSSTAGDFRNLTPLVLMRALQAAGTAVYEPIHHFALEIPADLLGPILPVLARVQAIPGPPTLQGASCTIEGEIPAANVHALQQQLPGATRGEGVLECAFAGYEPVRGAPPTRSRTDHNPLNRKEYLLNLRKRI